MQVSELQARVVALEAELHVKEGAHLMSADLASREAALAAAAADMAREHKEVKICRYCTAVAFRLAPIPQAC